MAKSKKSKKAVAPKPAEAPALRVRLRRAIPQDAVAIFNLVQKQQEAESPETPLNAMAGITRNLELITDGHVVVADAGGRLLGALGCDIFTKDKRQTYNVALFAIHRDFIDGGVDTALMRNLVTFTTKFEHILRVVVGEDGRAGSLLKGYPFGVVATINELDPLAPVEDESDDDQDADEPGDEEGDGEVPDLSGELDAPWLALAGDESEDEDDSDHGDDAPEQEPAAPDVGDEPPV